ncbi:hypothetical protein SAMD00019534_115600, partial [Acytostelium subglobosum LB1]|uniref:hypothetical protein n=1 Tax=Acytostelium subglobosum LB1 TaxID=1410327 RepID=UPI0006451CF9
VDNTTPGIVEGLGVIALDDLYEDQVVAIIPRSCLLSRHTTSIATHLRKYKIKGATATSIALIYEAALGPASKWHGYIKSLPLTVDLPILWDDESLALLKGTSIESVVYENRDTLEETFKKHVAGQLTANHPDLFPAAVFTLENFKRASCLVSSRAFNIDDYHGDAMVPLADMVKNDKESLLVSVVRPVKKGGEVFNTYGDHDNSLLLSKYGFLELDNPCDFVRIEPDLVDKVLSSRCGISEAVIQKRMAFYCEMFDEDTRECHAVEPNGTCDETLMCAVFIALATKEQMLAWTKMKRSKLDTYFEQLDKDGMIKANDKVAPALMAIIEERLKCHGDNFNSNDHSTSMSILQQQIDQLPNIPNSRHRNARSLQLCEQNILYKAHNQLK